MEVANMGGYMSPADLMIFNERAKYEKENRKYDYKLKGKDSTLKVKVVAVGAWDVFAIRSDNDKEDRFPIMYFKEHFEEIE